MLFIILIAFVLIFLLGGGYAAWKKSPKQKGKDGEERIHNRLTQLPEEYRLLEDVIFKTPKGTTQIDHIVVSKYGVFAIETKNYIGNIYGDDNREKWKQVIVNKVRYQRNPWKEYTYVTKNEFYNPVKQTLAHTYAIKKALQVLHAPVIPILVFTGGCIIQAESTSCLVITDSELIETILSFKEIVFSDALVDKITTMLTDKDVREIVTDQEHIQNIKAAKQAYEDKIYEGICPQCGGKLVKRNGRYGTFYGCSNYPNCKFTRED